jgi:hypothetical protein
MLDGGLPESKPTAPELIEGAEILIGGRAQKISCTKAVKYHAGGDFIVIAGCDGAEIRELRIQLNQSGSVRNCTLGGANVVPDRLTVDYADGTSADSGSSEANCSHTISTTLTIGLRSGRIKTAVFDAKYDKKAVFDVTYRASISPF